MKETTIISRGPGSDKFELRTSDDKGVVVKALKVGSRKLSKDVANLRASNRNREAGIVPQGTKAIATAEEFVNVLSQVSEGTLAESNVQLTADIDLTGVDYKPINSTDTKATLVFDGDGHIIRGFSVQDSVIEQNGSVYGAGFIAQYKGTLVVKNLTFSNCHVKVSDEPFKGNVVGAVVGYAHGDTLFENITVTNCIIEGYGKVGGILGMGSKAGMNVTFRNCVVVGNTFKGCYNVGGLAGNIQRGETPSFDNVTIDNCTVGTNVFELFPGSTEKPVEYKELDTVVSESNCPSLPVGYPVKGKYALLNGYWYAATAEHYISYGTNKHDCKLEGEEYPLANSEIIF